MQQHIEFLPAEFGEGWISRPARSMAQIAVVFGGFPASEVKRRLTFCRPEIKLNINHVGRVLDQIKAES